VGGGLDVDHGVTRGSINARGPRKSRGALPFQSLLWRLPWLRSTLLLIPPLAWFLIVYLASLALLLVTAFWAINVFTTQIVQVWNLDNFQTIVTDPTYRLIVGRTLLIAILVTVTDAVLAFPFAYFMARVASRGTQRILFAAVLLPLWASYLARVYAWILILNHDGVLNWSFQSLGLPAPNIGYTNVAMWLVFSYIWLPFMIVPVYGALERLPDSLLEAAADLGATRWRAMRDVVLPLVLPGIVAGSIFTFSLTLGDYITPTLIGGAGSSFVGTVIFNNIGVANNLPFAAALAMVPIAIMGVYLFLAGKLGAFEAL
jgi:putative spermidine/putrescine transport system permease protein